LKFQSDGDGRKSVVGFASFERLAATENNA
jgi:hypothetical protein